LILRHLQTAGARLRNPMRETSRWIICLTGSFTFTIKINRHRTQNHVGRIFGAARKPKIRH